MLTERLRRGSAEARAALSRAGRYRRVAGNLEVKEVRLGDGARAERFVICHNPEAAERDRQVRSNLVAYLESQIAGSDAWPRVRRDELVEALRTRPALYRLMRRTKEGKSCASTAPPSPVKSASTASGSCVPPMRPSPPPIWRSPTSSSTRSSEAGAT